MLDLKSRYVATGKRSVGTAREMLVESALTLLGFHVERVGLGVGSNAYVNGWSQGGDAFDFKACFVENSKLIQFYIEVTGCSLTLQQSRRILRGLLKLSKPGILIQKSKLEKLEKCRPDLPVVIVHVWDRLLRAEWTWPELAKQSALGELRILGEPNPYLATPLDIWRPLTELRRGVQQKPALTVADLMLRR